MQHCDPETLSLVALGEPAGPQDALHLAGCAQCRADVGELAAVVAAVRVDLPDGPPVPPPAGVWDRIAARTGVRVAPRPIGAVPGSSRGHPATDSSPSGAPVTNRGRGAARPAWRNRLLVAVAASALVAGGIGGSLVTRLVTGSGTDPGPGSVVAQARLAAFPLAPGAAGQATVVRAADGEQLVVDVSRLGALDGQYYEVWLIDTAVRQMVAVGILRGEEGRFVVPSGLDLHRFPVVDISVQEPGNPAHSGRSVLRGTLPA